MAMASETPVKKNNDKTITSSGEKITMNTSRGYGHVRTRGEGRVLRRMPDAYPCGAGTVVSSNG